MSRPARKLGTRTDYATPVRITKSGSRVPAPRRHGARGQAGPPRAWPTRPRVRTARMRVARLSTGHPYAHGAPPRGGAPCHTVSPLAIDRRPSAGGLRLGRHLVHVAEHIR